jgi:hypothetical protein
MSTHIMQRPNPTPTPSPVTFLEWFTFCLFPRFPNILT